MRMRTGRGGFTLVELLVVLVALAVLASVLFPIFARDRHRHHHPTCNSNLRQLALAIQMYAQDNSSQYPGIDGNTWPNKIAPYLGSSAQMFQCPDDNSGDIGRNSYAMAGSLIRENGTGVKESQVISPSEVGAICDAVPSMPYPQGRLIGGGGQKDPSTFAATIATRHSKGAIVGFCDGHAKYYQGTIKLTDEGNGAVRALYHAAPLGLIDNPVGCLPSGCGISGLKGTVFVGGEYATYPLLMGAAKMYGDFYTGGFKGQHYRIGRPKGEWVWGTVCTGPDTVAAKAVAYDAVCIIVAKGCKIPGLPALSNATYALRPATIRKLFETGYQKDTVQVYHMPGAYSSTNAYVKKVIGNRGWGTDSIVVANDAEMVEKVSNDPWGIGYCSSAFADPDRVVIIAPIIRGKTYVWPCSSTKFRWVMPSMKESDWPWKRSLDVVHSRDQLGTGIAAALRTGDFVKKGLYPGPLFTWGYWPGNY
ncbi:MAG: prepilin-type N-terminal cleavage/methylation domain-containing protein [Armatimonadota bacterium]